MKAGGSPWTALAPRLGGRARPASLASGAPPSSPACGLVSEAGFESFGGAASSDVSPPSAEASDSEVPPTGASAVDAVFVLTVFTLGGSIFIASRIFSDSTSLSMVLLKSLEARRNSLIILPRLFPISGSFRGPKTISATTKMRKSSGPPRVPNMITPSLSNQQSITPRRALTPICLSPYSGGMRDARRAAVAALALLVGARAGAEVPVVELDGVVHAVTAAHVVKAIDDADAAGAPLLVIRLDTPGGLDTSMRQIVDRMLNCRTPIAVFVGPSGARAASAGFIIAVSADVAVMAPGTNIGAAHPVSGLGKMDEVMSKKVTEDAAAYIRSKAERRGRNVEMAEKAVVESKSFTEKEALDLGLIDLIAQDIPDLLAQLEGREVQRFDGTKVVLELEGHQPVDVKMDWRQAILSAIARPEILFLLLLGTLAGIGAEISHPGLIFPGVLGVFCLVLFLFASQIIPVNWAGVLLVLLAVALFVAEVKVTSYGLLTVGGLVAMILGAMMLVDSSVPELQIGLGTLLPIVIAFAAFMVVLARLVLQAQLRRPSTGMEGLAGRPGEALSDLDPEGWVLVQGERWQARAEENVAKGEPIQVVAGDGLRLQVRKGA